MNKISILLTGAIATIILGALGSALWELALKPIFTRTGRYALRLYFSLIKKTRDSTFKQIACGSSDRAALFLSRILLLICVMTTGAILGHALSRRIIDPKAIYVEMKARSVQERADYMNNLFTIQEMLFAFTALWITFIVYFNYLRMNFIDSRLAMFNQACDILRPHLKPGQEYEHRAALASMQNEEDFIVLRDKLTAAAAIAKVSIPDINK